MKTIQIVPRASMRLYGAITRRQAEIRKGGRGTFSRVGARRANAARWSHIRYRGSITLKAGASDAVTAEIRSPERGDEARLMSSFLGWLDRHFGDDIASVNIQYLPPAARRKR
jgi:hypothetical protein